LIASDSCVNFVVSVNTSDKPSVIVVVVEPSSVEYTMSFELFVNSIYVFPILTFILSLLSIVVLSSEISP
jgi:hypothetical protein